MKVKRINSLRLAARHRAAIGELPGRIGRELDDRPARVPQRVLHEDRRAARRAAQIVHGGDREDRVLIPIDGLHRRRSHARKGEPHGRRQSRARRFV